VYAIEEGYIGVPERVGSRPPSAPGAFGCPKYELKYKYMKLLF
jgi:hypothetical protein